MTYRQAIFSARLDTWTPVIRSLGYAVIGVLLIDSLPALWPLVLLFGLPAFITIAAMDREGVE
ncbi:MAG: hypothetical protein JJ939_11550 [Alphaproteobacteria bacterium]|nr:hypothetical protein [Alphaproteobacteria bacterium]MBO6629050.1 hypothetical protein [Alphaproteobacteria bacterium]